MLSFDLSYLLLEIIWRFLRRDVPTLGQAQESVVRDGLTEVLYLQLHYSVVYTSGYLIW